MVVNVIMMSLLTSPHPGVVLHGICSPSLGADLFLCQYIKNFHLNTKLNYKYIRVDDDIDIYVNKVNKQGSKFSHHLSQVKHSPYLHQYKHSNNPKSPALQHPISGQISQAHLIPSATTGSVTSGYPRSKSKHTGDVIDSATPTVPSDHLNAVPESVSTDSGDNITNASVPITHIEIAFKSDSPTLKLPSIHNQHSNLKLKLPGFNHTIPITIPKSNDIEKSIPKSHDLEKTIPKSQDSKASDSNFLDINPPKSKSPDSDSTTKFLPLNYMDCLMADLINLTLRMLLLLITLNDKSVPKSISNPKPNHNSHLLTRYHSRSPPQISINSYLSRLSKFNHFNCATLLTTIYYIDLLSHNYKPYFTLNSWTIHRFLLVASMISQKSMEDFFFTNDHYAKVGGININELNCLELDFLYRINWKCIPVKNINEKVSTIRYCNDVLLVYYKNLIRLMGKSNEKGHINYTLYESRYNGDFSMQNQINGNNIKDDRSQENGGRLQGAYKNECHLSGLNINNHKNGYHSNLNHQSNLKRHVQNVGNVDTRKGDDDSDDQDGEIDDHQNDQIERNDDKNGYYNNDEDNNEDNDEDNDEGNDEGNDDDDGEYDDNDDNDDDLDDYLDKEIDFNYRKYNEYPTTYRNHQDHKPINLAGDSHLSSIILETGKNLVDSNENNHQVGHDKQDSSQYIGYDIKNGSSPHLKRHYSHFE
jgi:hypothetical protein